MDWDRVGYFAIFSLAWFVIWYVLTTMFNVSGGISPLLAIVIVFVPSYLTLEYWKNDNKKGDDDG